MRGILGQEVDEVLSLLLCQDHSANGFSDSKGGGFGAPDGEAASLREDPCSWAANESRAADRGPPAGAKMPFGGGATSSDGCSAQDSGDMMRGHI